jgi:hypothetical protein
MNLKKYNNNYDEVIAAGSSLGYNVLSDYTHWPQFIEDHFELGYQLHGISELIIIDHDKCGAYKVQYPEIESDPESERAHHVTNLTDCVDTLWEKYNPTNGTYTEKRIANLKVKGYLLSIDGSRLELIYQRE